jgi:hypothetical protein
VQRHRWLVQLLKPDRRGRAARSQVRQRRGPGFMSLGGKHELTQEFVAMSIGQHRCFGNKVSFVNTDRWSLESEVCTRVLPGATAKWAS